MINPSEDPLAEFVAITPSTPCTIVVTTFASEWTLEHLDNGEAHTCTRRPREHVAFRDPDATPSVEGRLIDGIAHRFRQAWWGRDEYGSLCLRIIPFVGSPGRYRGNKAAQS